MGSKQHQRILVFGGGFNPPTLAHEAIIDACLKLPTFDEVWVMPSGERLDKRMAISDDDRLHMLQLVKAQSFANNPRLHISDFELRLPRPTKTSLTIPALVAAYPDTTFWFAYGVDSYLSMPEWPDGVRLQKELKRLVLFSRGPASQIAGKHTISATIPDLYQTVSSTRVRQAIVEGASLAGLVSESVGNYLVRHSILRR